MGEPLLARCQCTPRLHAVWATRLACCVDRKYSAICLIEKLKPSSAHPPHLVVPRPLAQPDGAVAARLVESHLHGWVNGWLSGPGFTGA